MIEINIARQLLDPPRVNRQSYRGYVWLCAVLCLGIGVASWWWTQDKQQELEFLLQEKHVHAESLVKIQTTLSRLEQHQKQRELLRRAVKERHVQELEKKQPMALLKGVKRSIDGLGIWLDHVQMADQAVEIQGQSFSYEEIGKYIDMLENHQVIRSLSVVEILEQEDREGEKIFSFMIRFVLDPQVTA